MPRRGSCAQVFEEHREDHHGNGLASLQGTDADSKDQVDLRNTVVRIPDYKDPNGIADVPLTLLAVEAFEDQMASCGLGPFLFPSDLRAIRRH